MTTTPVDHRPYVVLHHTSVQTPHYDLMLDIADDAPLLTWRLRTWPGAEDAEPIAAHRRDYLTFEGELSGGRGRVTRVAGGTFRLIETRNGRTIIDADGLRISLPTTRHECL